MNVMSNGEVMRERLPGLEMGIRFINWQHLLLKNLPLDLLLYPEIDEGGG
jgi:hypothetical protein